MTDVTQNSRDAIRAAIVRWDRTSTAECAEYLLSERQWDSLAEAIDQALFGLPDRPADALPAPQDGPGGAGMGRAQTEPYLAPWSLGQTSRGGPTPVMDAEDRCIALFLTRQTAERAVRAVNRAALLRQTPENGQET